MRQRRYLQEHTHQQTLGAPHFETPIRAVRDNTGRRWAAAHKIAAAFVRLYRPLKFDRHAEVYVRDIPTALQARPSATR